MIKEEERIYQIALGMTAQIGPKTARRLYQYFGSAKAIFEASYQDLMLSQLLHSELADAIQQKSMLSIAEEEWQYTQQNNIEIHSIADDSYPQRLLPYEDSPFLIYYKGNADLNASRIVAVIGTRKPTEYGRFHVEKLIEQLLEYNVIVVSGLAYGIDALAHQKSVQLGIPNIGVVAHGLDRIYPAIHKRLAQQLTENGGLLTEFPINTRPVPGNFPARNRIIAGLADAVVVVETAKSGGSVITANIANEYQKDVFAIPGMLGAPFSEGCNHLIKTHRASLLSHAADIAYLLRWEKKKAAIQQQLFIELTAPEKQIINSLLGNKSIHINQLIKSTSLSTSRLSAILLQLELKGLIKAQAGKYYRLS